jgi:hypothetical protein
VWEYALEIDDQILLSIEERKIIMSIKVYNGYIFRNCDLNRAFSQLKSIQQESIQIAKNKMKNTFNKMLEAQKSDDKSSGLIAISNLVDNMKTMAVKENKVVGIDYTCELVLIPNKKDILVLLYSVDNSLYQELFQKIELQEFYYFNNTDKPEDISDSHWNKREKYWKESGIFENGTTTAQKGVTFHLVSWHNYDNVFEYY